MFRRDRRPTQHGHGQKIESWGIAEGWMASETQMSRVSILIPCNAASAAPAGEPNSWRHHVFLIKVDVHCLNSVQCSTTVFITDLKSAVFHIDKIYIDRYCVRSIHRHFIADKKYNDFRVQYYSSYTTHFCGNNNIAPPLSIFNVFKYLYLFFLNVNIYVCLCTPFFLYSSSSYTLNIPISIILIFTYASNSLFLARVSANTVPVKEDGRGQFHHHYPGC